MKIIKLIFFQEKETPKMHEVLPPKPPTKSCPPISRLKKQTRKKDDCARIVSKISINKDTGKFLFKLIKIF